jgi:hypothetical protein
LWSNSQEAVPLAEICEAVWQTYYQIKISLNFFQKLKIRSGFIVEQVLKAQFYIEFG